MNTHRQLLVWQKAQELLVHLYRLSSALPAEERFVAVPQLRRAAWSVSNNIAEGNAKLGKNERRRFFDCAVGSLAEIDSMIDGLTRLYPVEQRAVANIDQLRREVTGGIFGMLRRGRG